ncbi:hypothetical protein K1W54_34310, partial [Micromonospora sp. CPCC 205371]|nr:hypothetical protein [Micromonospora sp. CPCC 205371]
FSHQDPGFIDHVANKKAEVVREVPPVSRSLHESGGTQPGRAVRA